jgi:tryptophan 2,3-dioxygenase
VDFARPGNHDGGGDAALTYSRYLALDEILGAQRPRSNEHDEMLFIIVHQVYELWFKQLLHELAHLQQRMEAVDTPHVLHTLRRVLTILKVAVAQIDVLETMTPRQFTSFRERLDAASGFQSAQFRELEAVLGRRENAAGAPGKAAPAAVARRSVFDSFLLFLAGRGYPIPSAALNRDVRLPLTASLEVQEALLAVYDDDGEPAQVAERMVDLDEALQEWRYRHLKMVERTIGDKRGTGGSAGAGYLRGTLFTPVFPDLWDVRRRM